MDYEKLHKLMLKDSLRVLEYIVANKSVRNKDIMENLNIKPVPLTRALTNLQELGLISRTKKTVEVWYTSMPDTKKVIENAKRLSDSI